MNYYNEIDDKKAAWLRALITEGVISKGLVDNRPIQDVTSSDLSGFKQCHFFAGIGAWSYALRMAGWADDSPVWTVSCPCQPFSSMGKGKGLNDERHLWPEFSRICKESNPVVILGEQVASQAGLDWFDNVSLDLESQNYAAGAIDTCAASVGAPHVRQRLYWMAYTKEIRHRWRSEGQGLWKIHGAEGRSGLIQMATQQFNNNQSHITEPPGLVSGFWGAHDWVLTDCGGAGGPYSLRPVEPGSFPAASGVTARLLRLCGYGDCIVAPQATAFIEIVSDIIREVISGKIDF